MATALLQVERRDRRRPARRHRPSDDLLWDGDMDEDSVAVAIDFGWQVHSPAPPSPRPSARSARQRCWPAASRPAFRSCPSTRSATSWPCAGWRAWPGWPAASYRRSGWAISARYSCPPCCQNARHRALARALRARPEAEWRWGRLHRVSFQHEMTWLPGILRLWEAADNRPLRRRLHHQSERPLARLPTRPGRRSPPVAPAHRRRQWARRDDCRGRRCPAASRATWPAPTTATAWPSGARGVPSYCSCPPRVSWPPPPAYGGGDALVRRTSRKTQERKVQKTF